MNWYQNRETGEVVSYDQLFHIARGPVFYGTPKPTKKEVHDLIDREYDPLFLEEMVALVEEANRWDDFDLEFYKDIADLVGVDDSTCETWDDFWDSVLNAIE